jgi:putative addiction module killer protein
VLRTHDFASWIDDLKDHRGKQRILRRLDRLAQGHPGDVKPVGGGVSELRLAFGPGYRVYYLQDGRTVILLLCGGDKSTQRSDIEKAYRLAEEWKTYKDQEEQT